MPKLPVYNSQARLSTDAPEVMRSGAEKEGQAIAGVFDTISDLAIKLDTANRNIQETSIKYKHANMVAELEAKASVDTDVNGEVSKLSELDKSTQALLGEVSNPQLRSKLALELGHTSRISAIKINSEYTKKKMFVDALQTDGLIQSLAKQKSDAMTLGNAQLAASTDAQAIKFIQDKVSAGLLTKAQGLDKIKDYRMGAVDFDIATDTSTTQAGSLILAELKKGKSGRYSNLDESELADKIKDAKINIWRNKVTRDKQRTEIHTQTALDLSSALVNGTLTDSKIDELLKDDFTDSTTATIFKNAVNKKNTAVPDESEKTNADNIIKLTESSSALEALKVATREYGNKGIKDTTYSYIVQEIAKKADRERQGIPGWQRGWNNFLNAVVAISTFNFSMLGKDNKSDLNSKSVDKIVEKINSGTDPKVAVKEVSRENVADMMPQASTFPKEGKLVMDSNGNIKRVTPEYDILDEDESDAD